VLVAVPAAAHRHSDGTGASCASVRNGGAPVGHVGGLIHENTIDDGPLQRGHSVAPPFWSFARNTMHLSAVLIEAIFPDAHLTGWARRERAGFGLGCHGASHSEVADLSSSCQACFLNGLLNGERTSVVALKQIQASIDADFPAGVRRYAPCMKVWVRIDLPTEG
jgi:hypothetical protein